MADRIAVMHQGRVQQVGPPLTIYGDPANRFVAGFFGIPAMNFIEGELRGDSDGLTFDAPAVAFALKRRGLMAPCAATLGIRPEHVRLTSDGRGPSAKVSLTEPLGDETLVFLEYGGPASLVAKVDAEEKVAVGDRRGFSFRGDRIVFFDALTGDRILR